MNVITKKIEKHFNELGIKKNDNIIIHSNIITFGIFNKNLSKLIIDIIIDRIGRDGLWQCHCITWDLTQKK